MPDPPRDTELLYRAVRYGLASMETGTQRSLADPTPCAGWNLRELICHLNDSLAVLQQGADSGRVPLDTPPHRAWPAPELAPATGAEDLVERFRVGAQQQLANWRTMDRADVLISDQAMPAHVVEIVGAIEIAVHGWDIFESRGRQRPIPVNLSLDSYEYCLGSPEI